MTAVKKKRRLDSRSDLPLVYDQYKPEPEEYIRRRVDSAEDTEDILQDVFYIYAEIFRFIGHEILPEQGAVFRLPFFKIYKRQPPVMYDHVFDAEIAAHVE